jgi:hypothetical protein
MNMLYEGLKKNNATIVIVPSTAVETMRLGGQATLTALTATLGQERSAGRSAGSVVRLWPGEAVIGSPLTLVAAAVVAKHGATI